MVVEVGPVNALLLLPPLEMAVELAELLLLLFNIILLVRPVVVGVKLRRPMTLVGLVDLADGADAADVCVVAPVEPAEAEMVVTPTMALLSIDDDGGRRGRLFCNFNQSTQQKTMRKNKKTNKHYTPRSVYR